MEEPIILEYSLAGKRGITFPSAVTDNRPLGTILPEKYMRKASASLPEVSEPEVVRHFTRLSQKNFSADTNFYPLGSCTMKYNPKMNEAACGLPGFKDLHPYQSESTVQGTLQLLWNLEQCLCELTGMGSFSLHPAAGAHGEFVGLKVAAAHFKAKGQKRSKVIVPDTAHGTNPASAALAGFSVVSVPSNVRGRIDKEKLKSMMDSEVALVMVTCPNTLGLFEDEIVEIADIVHKQGGLLYMDGANFNALVGLVHPAKLGFDIMHLNLHKTFSVPHGGGGPGAGPVGVTSELSVYLPDPRIQKNEKGFILQDNCELSIGKVRSYFGSTGALIRAYTYIRSLGHDGLKAVSKNAILNANYLLEKLKPHFAPFIDEPCMHECVLSASAYAKQGFRTLDIVKRLLDYGFYAPTIYFPLIVPEAMMVEPTETESKKSMDDFVRAIEKILAEGKKDPQFLRSAPHTTPVRRLDEVAAARNPVLRWPERH